MDTAAFDFDLPPDRIAQQPVEPRDASRLLVLDRRTGTRRHLRFRQLPELLMASDLIVRNETRVSEYQFRGRRESGGSVGVTLLEPIDHEQKVWRCLVRGVTPEPGSQLALIGEGGTEIPGRVREIAEDGTRVIQVSQCLDSEMLARHGTVPLPPYIKDFCGDRNRYQTVYARKPGSVAAPTAGLHFTEALLQQVAKNTMGLSTLTLHVGRDTFAPVRADDLTEHCLSGERVEIPAATANEVNRCHQIGGRVFSVGTTTTRSLEWAANCRATDTSYSKLSAVHGLADTYIFPGFRFQVVDCLLTNFHLPRSTPLFMISAFIGDAQADPDSGRKILLETYSEAIKEGYRFYSFGDAMLII